jgi:hypothetical protein
MGRSFTSQKQEEETLVGKLLNCRGGWIFPLSVTAMTVFCASGFAAAQTRTVSVDISFVDRVAISAPQALQAGLPGRNLAGEKSVTIALADAALDEAAAALPGAHDIPSAASFTIATTPGRVMTIYVDSVVPGAAYSLTDFRCSYGRATDVPCDGAGFSQIAAASGTLRIGATLVGASTHSGGADGRFEVTVSYQ